MRWKKVLMIPFSDEPGTYKLFIVLEDDNIERIHEADPAQISFPVPGWESERLVLILVGYANAGDRNRVLQYVQENRPMDALKYLSRGFQFRPERGDYDGPPTSLRAKGERRQ
jgi:hypothetical protein